MTDFNINAFGSLTTSAGKKLEFKDFDKNGDGKISEEEYNSLLKEVQLDNVEMSSVDKNDDKMIDEKEFTSWENKIEMQNAVNDMAKQIAVDFAGVNPSTIKILQNELKYFIEDFAKDYKGTNIVEDFKKALPEKYEELKAGLLNETPAPSAAATRGATGAGEDTPPTNNGYINGDRVSINPSSMNFASIEGYYGDGQIYERGKGWSGSRDKAMEKGVELLNSPQLKDQIKAQIEKELKDQGIDFKDFEYIFINTYNQSVQDTLNSDGMITGRGAKGLSKKGKAYINIKECVDKFIETFNQNIKKAIGEMNENRRDMDMDLDLTVLGDYKSKYFTGEEITGTKEELTEIATDVVGKLKPQLQAKAELMSQTYNTNLNQEVFESIFSNASALAMNEALSSDKLNIQKLVNTLGAQFKELYTNAIKSDTGITRSEGKINSDLISVNYGTIDLTKVEGYDDGGQIYERGKGWSGSKAKAMEKGVELLNAPGLKNQIKAQIEKELKAQGLEFKNFEYIFINTYNQSVQDTLNSDGMITGRGARGLKKEGKAYIDKQACVQKFVEVLNENMKKAIREMNATDRDMDLDIDLSALKEYEDSYFYGKDIKGENPEDVKGKASEIIDSLKPELKAKAELMCETFGIEFDEDEFNSIFNNSTLNALQMEHNFSGTVFERKIEFSFNAQTLVNSFCEQFKEKYTDYVLNHKGY